MTGQQAFKISLLGKAALTSCLSSVGCPVVMMWQEQAGLGVAAWCRSSHSVACGQPVQQAECSCKSVLGQLHTADPQLEADDSSLSRQELHAACHPTGAATWCAALTKAPGLAWLLLCCEASLVVICYAIHHALPPQVVRLYAQVQPVLSALQTQRSRSGELCTSKHSC
jgi:hypothetical protein